MSLKPPAPFIPTIQDYTSIPFGFRDRALNPPMPMPRFAPSPAPIRFQEIPIRQPSSAIINPVSHRLDVMISARVVIQPPQERPLHTRALSLISNPPRHDPIADIRPKNYTLSWTFSVPSQVSTDLFNRGKGYDFTPDLGRIERPLTFHAQIPITSSPSQILNAISRSTAAFSERAWAPPRFSDSLSPVSESITRATQRSLAQIPKPYAKPISPQLKTNSSLALSHPHNQSRVTSSSSLPKAADLLVKALEGFMTLSNRVGAHQLDISAQERQNLLSSFDSKSAAVGVAHGSTEFIAKIGHLAVQVTAYIGAETLELSLRDRERAFKSLNTRHLEQLHLLSRFYQSHFDVSPNDRIYHNFRRGTEILLEYGHLVSMPKAVISGASLIAKCALPSSRVMAILSRPARLNVLKSEAYAIKSANYSEYLINRGRSFAGSRRAPLEYASFQTVRNETTVINNRTYVGHALDRMQDRGFMPSIIENAIKTGKVSSTKIPGRVEYYDPINNLRVIVQDNERIISVIPKRSKS